jgi:5-methyltetrahydropteroyltriglutamate--homocysteine methyltransferase
MKSADRAEHVGSLLRPPEVLKARAAFAEKRLDQEQLREAKDRAILDVLVKQTAAGLDRVSDGEFRRGSGWRGSFATGWCSTGKGREAAPRSVARTR